MSKKHNNSPLEEYILLSPAPVDLATKLAHTLLNLSDKVSIEGFLAACLFTYSWRGSHEDTGQTLGGKPKEG